MKKVMLLLAVLVFGGCSSNYSKGFRIGTVRKFSEKGVFIKSWEGELLLGGVVSTGGKNPELVNETFDFSVDPEATHGEDIPSIVSALSEAADSGKRTKIYYVEDTTPKIRSHTGYYVQKVEILKD